MTTVIDLIEVVDPDTRQHHAAEEDHKKQQA